ncbi:MAG TPA: glycerophosphodiester phosphodiesterase family protein [Pyrinomonadaceae bacterium]|nr:glycerophosphodiester phosphodiesterase family protein [Pyrinomonadaceae bacterium]
MKKPLIIAHRGASALAPENTLAAFEKAISDGAEGIEFDVRLSKDGAVVVFHDATLGRLSDRKNLVSSLSVEELQKIDVGTWFGKRRPNGSAEDFSGETIPTLPELLDFLKDFTGLIYIELKCRESEIEKLVKAVCKTISDSPLLEQIIVKSFQLETLPHIRRACPKVKTAALFAPKIMTLLRKEKRLVNIAHELGADMISVHFSLATRKLMKKAAKKNLPVTIWTADNPRWIRRAFDLGLFAVITNNPAVLLAKRAEVLEKD